MDFLATAFVECKFSNFFKIRRSILLDQGLNDRNRTSLVPINRFYLINEVSEKNPHFALFLNHYINLSVLKLQRYTIPRKKWKISDFLDIDQRIDMLPQHPKPGRNAPKNDALDLRDVTAT